MPTTNETLTPDGVGRFNHFAEGASIYWTRKTGAWSVQGRIRDLWAEPGWKLGESRYPTSDERPTGDGRARYTTFQNGRIYWTPSGGAHGVYGSIHSRYVALGAESSRLGLPTSDEYAVPGGRASDFEHGHIAWNARTGATTVSYR